MKKLLRKLTGGGSKSRPANRSEAAVCTKTLDHHHPKTAPIDGWKRMKSATNDTSNNNNGESEESDRKWSSTVEEAELVCFPPEILEHSFLKVVRLSGNSIHILPQRISTLAYLEELYLERNDITCIPETLMYCGQLKVLNLSMNPLGGAKCGTPEPDSGVFTIPYMRNITELCLNCVGLKTLPPSLTLLCSLKHLELRDNRMRSLPADIHKLKYLEFLDVGRNVINELPETLERLVHLRHISLDWNEFSSFPQALERLVSLEILELNGNFLRAIPTTADNFLCAPILTDVDISDNQLIAFPEFLSEAPSLCSIKMDNNLIKRWPERLQSVSTSLHYLSLRNNRLTCVPRYVVSNRLSILSELYLDDNLISSIPPVDSESALRVVSLRNNRLSHLHMGWARQLVVVDLRGNHLSTAPDGLLRRDANDNGHQPPLVVWFYYGQVSAALPSRTADLLRLANGGSGQRCSFASTPSFYADGAEWSITQNQLRLATKTHDARIRAQIKASRAGASNHHHSPTSDSQQVLLLPSSAALGCQNANRTSTGSGEPTPIRPYAMVDLKTLQKQLRDQELERRPPPHCYPTQFPATVGNNATQPQRSVMKKQGQYSSVDSDYETIFALKGPAQVGIAEMGTGNMASYEIPKRSMTQTNHYEMLL